MQVVEVVGPIRIGFAQTAQRSPCRLTGGSAQRDERSRFAKVVADYNLKPGRARAGDRRFAHADGDNLAAHDGVPGGVSLKLAPMRAQKFADAQLAKIGETPRVVDDGAHVGGAQIGNRRKLHAAQLRLGRGGQNGDKESQEGANALHGDLTFDHAIFIPVYHGGYFGRNRAAEPFGFREMTSAADQTRSDIAAMLPRLRRFARALTGQVADADDIVQIAMERALTRMDQFQLGTRLDAWLFAIVRNAWLDEARARTRRAKVFAPAELGDYVGHDGAAEAHAKLEADEVWTAMRKLPEEQREAVALVCVEGLAYREAAETLGVPIGTLTSRLSRGREALQVMLGGAR